jgi:hypothetical protein
MPSKTSGVWGQSPQLPTQNPEVPYYLGKPREPGEAAILSNSSQTVFVIHHQDVTVFLHPMLTELPMENPIFLGVTSSMLSREIYANRQAQSELTILQAELALLEKAEGNSGRTATAKVLNWSDFLYFSTITQATVGYGDILPNKTIVRMVVIIQCFASLIIVTFAVAAVTSHDNETAKEPRVESG